MTLIDEEKLNVFISSEDMQFGFMRGHWGRDEAGSEVWMVGISGACRFAVGAEHAASGYSISLIIILQTSSGSLYHTWAGAQVYRVHSTGIQQTRAPVITELSICLLDM